MKFIQYPVGKRTRRDPTESGANSTLYNNQMNTINICINHFFIERRRTRRLGVRLRKAFTRNGNQQSIDHKRKGCRQTQNFLSLSTANDQKNIRSQINMLIYFPYSAAASFE